MEAINESCYGEIGKVIAEIKNHLSQSPGLKKRFEYNTIIVSLYGYLEQFLESLIIAYVKALNNTVPHFKNLPEVIKKNHLDLSVGFINRLELRQFKNKATPQKLISNLHSCYSDGTCFTVNADAFAQHTANFRIEIIDSFFARVGIQKISETVREVHGFKEYLTSKFPDRPIEGIKPEISFYYLDDLSERRNHVAHGVEIDEFYQKICS